MDANKPLLADRGLWKEFGTADHRETARQAVRESVVLLKNDSHVLPLRKDVARIHVGGRSADDLGNQCGGWTIDWQGKSGEVTTGGTTLLAAIRKTVGAATNVTYSKDGLGAEGATVGVVVVGEKPYAEFEGDRPSLELASEDATAIGNMKAAGIPVVVVLFSGRPMVLGESLNQADAFMAAWLPGTEGQGVADVLFGDYRPTGKLSFHWQDVFARGFGLSY
jgi:beta-glucosidase